MEAPPEQRRPVQQLHRVRNRHLMFVDGKTKEFLLPLRIFRDCSFDKRPRLQKVNTVISVIK